MDKSPDAFRTISEVAEHLETPAHVLRFWESRFPQIRPVKRAGGRRYYRPTDVALLSGIKRLLHDEGMTIRGVQKILREQGVRHVAGLSGVVLVDDTELDAESALEAALSSFLSPKSEELLPVEADTAQIFALETALRRPEAIRTVDTVPVVPDAAADIVDAHAPEDKTEDVIAGFVLLQMSAELEIVPVPHVDPGDLLRRLRAGRKGALHLQRPAIEPLRDRLRALHDRMSTPPPHRGF